ncbi:uncharacterized protein LOC144303242 isoform X2 [Canis aureus]
MPSYFFGPQLPDREIFHQPEDQPGTSSPSPAVENQEALKTYAPISQFLNLAQDKSQTSQIREWTALPSSCRAAVTTAFLGIGDGRVNEMDQVPVLSKLLGQQEDRR